MSQSIGKIEIVLDQEARRVLTATKIDYCRAYNCLSWSNGNCMLKATGINEFGGCAEYRPKETQVQNAS